jgi:hypothetical protein
MRTAEPHVTAGLFDAHGDAKFAPATATLCDREAAERVVVASLTHLVAAGNR